tara:strand:+ start:30 stop:221 length:192 start_codon:yes stop_codon:yes gene_type:complete
MKKKGKKDIAKNSIILALTPDIIRNDIYKKKIEGILCLTEIPAESIITGKANNKCRKKNNPEK